MNVKDHRSKRACRRWIDFHAVLGEQSSVIAADENLASIERKRMKHALVCLKETSKVKKTSSFFTLHKMRKLVLKLLLNENFSRRV